MADAAVGFVAREYSPRPAPLDDSRGLPYRPILACALAKWIIRVLTAENVQHPRTQANEPALFSSNTRALNSKRTRARTLCKRRSNSATPSAPRSKTLAQHSPGTNFRSKRRLVPWPRLKALVLLSNSPRSLREGLCQVLVRNVARLNLLPRAPGPDSALSDTRFSPPLLFPSLCKFTF